MFKVNNKDNRTMPKAPGVFSVNLKHILHLALVFLLFTLTHFSPVSHFYTPSKGFLTFSRGTEM